MRSNGSLKIWRSPETRPPRPAGEGSLLYRPMKGLRSHILLHRLWLGSGEQSKERKSVAFRCILLHRGRSRTAAARRWRSRIDPPGRFLANSGHPYLWWKVFARGAESTVFTEDSWGWHTQYGFAILVIGGRNWPKTQVKGRILATLAKITHRYGLSPGDGTRRESRSPCAPSRMPSTANFSRYGNRSKEC